MYGTSIYLVWLSQLPFYNSFGGTFRVLIARDLFISSICFHAVSQFNYSFEAFSQDLGDIRILKEEHHLGINPSSTGSYVGNKLFSCILSSLSSGCNLARLRDIWNEIHRKRRPKLTNGEHSHPARVLGLLMKNFRQFRVLNVNLSFARNKIFQNHENR